MPINKLSGEIGIHTKDKDYVIRPSLRKLAEVEDIESDYYKLSSAERNMRAGFFPSASYFLCACSLLTALCDDDIPDEVLGSFGVSVRKGGISYKPGLMSPMDLITIAAYAAKIAIFGKPSEQRLQYYKYKAGMEKSDLPPVSSKFDPLTFVSIAVAPKGLGLSYAEAWNMTMIEFQAAIEAQFPIPKEELAKIPPSGKELEGLQEQVARAHAAMKGTRRVPVKLNRGSR